MSRAPYIEVDDLMPFVDTLLRGGGRPRLDPRRALMGELERRKCIDVLFGKRCVVVDKLQQEWTEMWIAWDAKQAEDGD